MPTAEKERLALYRQLNLTIGPDHAETLMEYLPPQKWADLATKEDLRVTAKELRAEMAGLRTEMSALKTELQAEMGGLKTEMRAEMSALKTEMRAEMQTGFAMMESKFAQQTRTTVLVLAGFAATIWASLFATVLVVT